MRSLMRRLFYSLIKLIVDWQTSKSDRSISFPASRGRNYLNEPLFPNRGGGGYFSKFFSEDTVNPLALSYTRFKLEIVEGRLYRSRPYRVEIDVPSALPYAVTNVDFFNTKGYYSAQLRYNGQDYRFTSLVSERFYYLPLRKKGTAELQSDYDLVIGKPIPLIQTKKHKNKLILILFVDSFTTEVMERISPEKDIPNIHNFFSKGMVFENCFANSNWTVPGVASIVSGRTLTGHGMFHPQKDIVVGDGYPMLSEILQKDGYLTFQACGNWRKTPSYGYVKGFDRTIYRNGLTLGDTLNGFFDHMRAFPERDNFVWLSFNDLHHLVSFVPEVANQLGAPLEAHDYYIGHDKSPLQLDPNPPRARRFVEELKRIDFHLGPLFSFIETNFDNEEMLVAVCSDHGTTYFTEDPKGLSRERCNVAFMLRGGGVPAGRSDELVQNTDILPTILKLTGTDTNAHFEGRVPEVLGGPAARKRVFTEILYPGTPYEATVKDKGFDFYFKTEANVDEEGNVDLSRNQVSLFLKDDFRVDVSADHRDVMEDFKRVVAEHRAGRAPV
jgi:arylsulfatase A-like enzyme